METAANAVVAQVQQWYASKGADYFDGDHHPSGVARSFMRGVQSHWFGDARGKKSFDVYFSNPRENGANFGLLRHEYGGTIYSKGRLLTIPIDPNARGKTTKSYEETYGKLHFIPRKKKAKPGLRGVLAWQSELGKLVTAYALYSEVTIPSLQERKGVPAVPPDEQVAAWAQEALMDAIEAADTL